MFKEEINEYPYLANYFKTNPQDLADKRVYWS
jgi:hypothetical protein